MARTVLIVEAHFYPDIAEMLAKAAIEVLRVAEVKIERAIVPGALEIPAAIRMAADSQRYAGFVALGCVIRGETTHYDIVANESARGLQMLALHDRLAIGNGIITCENFDQALERADGAKKNMGGRAANACLNMMKLKKHFSTDI